MPTVRPRVPLTRNGKSRILPYIVAQLARAFRPGIHHLHGPARRCTVWHTCKCIKAFTYNSGFPSFSCDSIQPHSLIWKMEYNLLQSKLPTSAQCLVHLKQQTLVEQECAKFLLPQCDFSSLHMRSTGHEVNQMGDS